MGAWQFQQAKSVFEIMSAADNSLRQAEQNTKAFVLLSDIDKTTEIRSASEWQNILVHAIKHDLFVLYFQPIKSAKSEVILHYEVFLRIKTLEKDMTGKWFSPYAELFGKATVLDKIIIEKITDFIKSSPNTHYAISLSNQSLNDSDFAAWLSQYLQAHPELSNRLLLETTETNVLNSLPQTKQLQHILKSFHIKFGIDKFAHSVSNFDYLQEIIPDYIKFSELFSEDIVEDKKNQFSIKSIIQLAHDLDCMAIACNIETQNQQDTLRELNVDALQGDWIGKPEIHTL